MKKIIVITSGKGGVGKTTSAINLGAAMNYFGEDVLVIDANLTTPNVGIHLNSPEVPIDLNQVLLGKADPEEAVYEHESGMKVMPSSISIKELKKIKPDRIKDFKKDFQKLSDIVIIDSSAGLGHETSAVMSIADEIIIVTNPEIAAITDALKTLKVAENMNIPIRGVIVTRVKKDDIEMGPDSVKEMLEADILGMVPESKIVQKSLKLRDPVVHIFPKSNPARAYKEIAAKLLGIEYDSDAEREKMYERILRAFGLRN